MSKEDKLLKRLKGDKTYIPFNDHYNFQEILKFIDDNKDSFDIKNQEKAIYSIYFNQYYVFFRDLLTNTFEKNKISIETQLDAFFSKGGKMVEYSAFETNLIYVVDKIFQDSVNKTMEELGYKELKFRLSLSDGSQMWNGFGFN